MLISTDSEYQCLVSNLLLSISIFHCNIPSMIPVYTDKHSQLILSFSYVSSPHSSLAPICLSFSLYHDVYMIYLHIYGVETNRNGCIKHNSTLSNYVVVNFKSKLKADKYPFCTEIHLFRLRVFLHNIIKIQTWGIYLYTSSTK